MRNDSYDEFMLVVLNSVTKLIFGVDLKGIELFQYLYSNSEKCKTQKFWIYMS